MVILVADLRNPRSLRRQNLPILKLLNTLGNIPLLFSYIARIIAKPDLHIRVKVAQ